MQYICGSATVMPRTRRIDITTATPFRAAPLFPENEASKRGYGWDIDAELVRLGRERVESVLMWPVAFVSDHIETLHEIDIEYAELAHSVGIKDYRRVPNLNADSDFVEFLAHTIIQGDRDLSQYGFSSVVRDLETHPSGEGCHRQAGGCLCGRYFTSGSEGLERGVVPSRMSASQVPLEVRERAYSSSPQTSQATPSQDVRESHAHRL